MTGPDRAGTPVTGAHRTGVPAGTPPSRGRWFKIGFGLVATAAGIWYLAATWGRTGPALAAIGPGAALLALVPAAAGLVAAMLAWRRILADLGHPLPPGPAGRIFFASQLGKYVPGSVWTFVAQVELGRAHRVPRAVSLAASMLALVVSLCTGLAVAALLLPLGAGDALHRFRWLWLVAPLLLVAAHPGVTVRVLDAVLRRLGRPPLAVRPTVRGVLGAAALSAVGWLLLGAQCAILVTAAGGRSAAVVPLSVGGFALAFCAGVLFIPAPAGVGVRELALGLALATVIPAPASAAVVLVSRLGLALLDLALAGGWTLAGRTRAGATPADRAVTD